MDKTIVSIEDDETRKTFDFIFQNAFGNPIIFSSAPSLSDMKANSWGVNGTDIYIKFADNTGIKISGTALT